MHVFFRPHALHDGHAPLVAGLPDDIADAPSDRAAEHRISVLRRPDDVVSSVSAGIVCGHRSVSKNESVVAVRSIAFGTD